MFVVTKYIKRGCRRSILHTLQYRISLHEKNCHKYACKHYRNTDSKRRASITQIIFTAQIFTSIIVAAFLHKEVLALITISFFPAPFSVHHECLVSHDQL